MRGISVIVLTWNGIDLLKECLPKVVASLDAWTIPHELIIVDNGSVDGSVEYIHDTYSDITFVGFDRNLGFGRANNIAVDNAQFDTVLFLNNDLYLAEGFIEPLYEALAGEDVFAAAPKMLRWDKKTIDDGLRYAQYYSGLLSVELEKDSARFDEPHWVTFFCGGCFLCKKDLFIRMGKFDPLYTPYAWEDLDLGYRAWKRGYKVAYEPRSVAYHKREATTRDAFSNFFFITLMWKNKFIFMWKNITSLSLLGQHFALLPWKLIKFLCNGRWRYVCGFFRAVPSMPVIIMRRICETKHIRMSDEDVLLQSYTMRKK